MLPKYKLLTTLYLSQRFNGSTGSPPSADLFRHLLGASYGQTISRLHKEKLIQSKIPDLTDRDPGSLFITYLGTNALLSHYPLLDYFQSPFRHPDPAQPEKDLHSRDSSGRTPQNDGGWDGGKFTLVVFNIPEEKRRLRDRLRYVLKSAGFGQINRSLHLSPHLTVKETVQMTNDQMTDDKRSKVIAFSVPFESFKEIDKGTLTNFWDLEEVGELYEEALAFAEEKPDELRTSTRRVGESARYLSKFLDAFGKDPFLPPRLLPDNWPGRKALEVAKEILTT